MKTSYIIVMVTTASKAEAETIAERLLEAKLIACANIIGPIESHFHWSGKIDKAEEFGKIEVDRSQKAFIIRLVDTDRTDRSG